LTTEVLGTGAQVDKTKSLIDEGLLDSMGIVRLVTFLESEMQCPVPNSEFVAANFVSLETIEAMYRRLLGERPIGAVV
jgi:acyl carrier protein